MIHFIARYLPKRIRLEVARQFLTAMVVFGPKGMDTTIRDLQQHLTRRKW